MSGGGVGKERRVSNFLESERVEASKDFPPLVCGWQLRAEAYQDGAMLVERHEIRHICATDMLAYTRLGLNQERSINDAASYRE
jgi:hypothetical protein